jgi:hypothetical protein
MGMRGPLKQGWLKFYPSSTIFTQARGSGFNDNFPLLLQAEQVNGKDPGD